MITIGARHPVEFDLSVCPTIDFVGKFQTARNTIIVRDSLRGHD